MSDNEYIEIRIRKTFAFILMMLLNREGIGENVANQIAEKLSLGTGREITPLGKYIRKVRVENKITLLEMSKALGMKPSELCGIETGDIEKPRFFAAAVAQYFSSLNISFDCGKLFALDGQKTVKEIYERLDKLKD